MTAERIITREILEDRWEGLLDVGAQAEKRWGRIHDGLMQVYMGMLHHDTLSDHDGSPDFVILDELFPLLREHMIRRILETGAATWMPDEHALAMREADIRQALEATR